MNIYFEHSDGRLTQIGCYATDLDESWPVAMEVIRKFCEDHHYQIPYTRLGLDERTGKPMTCVDVGSHTEFFWIEPPLQILT